MRSITSRVEGIYGVYQQPFCASLSSAQVLTPMLFQNNSGRGFWAKCNKRQIAYYGFQIALKLKLYNSNKQNAGPFEGFDAATSSQGFNFNNGAFNKNAPARNMKHTTRGSRQMDFDKISASILANHFVHKTINIAYWNRWKIKHDKIQKKIQDLNDEHSFFRKGKRMHGLTLVSYR